MLKTVEPTVKFVGSTVCLIQAVVSEERYTPILLSLPSLFLCTFIFEIRLSLFSCLGFSTSGGASGGPTLLAGMVAVTCKGLFAWVSR